MSSNGQAFVRPATFEDKRFCPYHGDFIRLADCSIVATNEEYVNRDSEDGSEATLEDVLAGLNAEAEKATMTRRRRKARGRGRRGERIVSTVDGKSRLVVHDPPQPPAQQPRGLFARKRPEPLPLPAELALSVGGARVRPARACPECKHPLPEAIDSHDPMLIPLVGHTAASKTTTMAAFIDQLSEQGPGAFNLSDVGPTEATSARLTETMRLYRSGEEVKGTEADTWMVPMEFFAEPGNGMPPAVLFFHDVAGENVMQANQRLVNAPFVLWADAILFVYNPEASPRLRPSGHDQEMDIRARDIEQSAVLNGLLNDLKANPRLDPNGNQHNTPPLVVAVSKADVLPGSPPIETGSGSETAVKAALHDLGDRGFVAAGERWPEVHWRFIAPQPPNSRPQGIVDLFSLLLSIVTR
jgi:hypothetical protein